MFKVRFDYPDLKGNSEGNLFAFSAQMGVYDLKKIIHQIRSKQFWSRDDVHWPVHPKAFQTMIKACCDLWK